jgi:hypothetical protein
VSKRQSPKTEIGGCVGDTSKDELDGFNKLMDCCFSELMLLRRHVLLLKDSLDLLVSFISGYAFSFRVLLVLNRLCVNLNMVGKRLVMVR